jgi:2-polyprenyl-6-methoxyphenol hydroxylase-like FAD-dependent oxidoreductase
VSAGYRASVLVVGGGPVGLAAAMELDYHGVSTIVVEPRESVSYLRPRAKTTSARTMELFRRWGFAETIRKVAPLHIDWSKDIVFVTTVTGHEVTRITGALGLTLDDVEVSAEPSQQIAQPIAEQAMRDALAKSPRSQLLLGWKATDIGQGPDSVVVTVENTDGVTATVEADYLVGADGPRSVVRSAIGASYVGTSIPRANISITFESEALDTLIPHGPAVQYWVLNPDSPGIVGRLDLDKTWWAISTARPGDGTDSEVDPELIVKELLGADIPVRVIATDPWVARTLIADSYRDRRVFIIGDAAHQNPPWGGHGFNTGVGDAINIGWKLAAVLKGWAPTALLDSYEGERRPIAEQFVAAAAENGKSGPMALGTPELMLEGEEFEKAREQVAAGVQFAKRIEFHSDGLIFGLGYDGQAGGQTTNGSDYTPIAASGNRLPHKWLTPGVSLYDRLGPDFTVIGAAADVATLVDLAVERHVPLATLDDPTLKLDEFFGAKVILVRPDQYIAWIGGPLNEASAAHILDRALLGFGTPIPTTASA